VVAQLLMSEATNGSRRRAVASGSPRLLTSGMP
jgi:hypothetical protein